MKLQVFGETHSADFILTADLSSLACFQGVYHVGSNSMLPGLYNLSIVLFWSYVILLQMNLVSKYQGWLGSNTGGLGKKLRFNIQ